jgi:SPX domain protein involved in polyphosphate accumulation
VKHLPYLVFGQTIAEQEQHLLSAENLLNETSDVYRPQLITSVYFDSECGHSYEERLLRKEGARLLRLRWYGRNEGNADKEIYVERKIHHESWTKTASSKDRFALNQGSVRAFLSGRYVPEATPLADEVRDMIATHKLRPMVRTCYFRSAFQAQDSNAVRISLDTNLTLINELSGISNFWCRSADDVLSAADIVKFPFAILEVKLQDGGNPPEWIGELLRKSQAVRVHKFSKFVHGMAFIHGPRVARHLPHWMDKVDEFSKQEFSESVLLDMGIIEPKSLFANERTFLHYTLKAVYLLLLDLSTVSAVLVAVYTAWCLFHYFARARKILGKRAVEGGADRLDVAHGPLVVLILVGASLASLLRF